MDAGGGGPDSGIDTGSPNFCGFRSPRDLTTSDTSGADVTDLASGEEIPFDAVNSFDSASEFNVWRSAHKTPLRGFGNDNGPLGGGYSNESLCVRASPATLLTKNTVCSEQIVPDFEADQSYIQSDIKNKNDCSDRNFDIENKNECKLPGPLAATEISSNVVTSNADDYNWQSGMTANNNSNHYFIDASSLLDDSELVPPLHTSAAPARETIAPSVAMSGDSRETLGVNQEQNKALQSPLAKKYTWSGNQNTVAEFERELTLATHLEPLGSAKRASATGGDDVITSSDLSSTNATKKLVDSFGTDLQIVPSASHEELASSDTFKEASLCNVNQCDVGNKSRQPAPVDAATSDANPPTLIRQKTFELDPDDERLALLRQDYERRQGNLLFKTSILQFSTHLVAAGLDGSNNTPVADSNQGICPSGMGGTNDFTRSAIDVGSDVVKCESYIDMSASLPSQSGFQNPPMRQDFVLNDPGQSQPVLGCKQSGDLDSTFNSLDHRFLKEPISPANSLVETSSDLSMKIPTGREGDEERKRETARDEVKLSRSCDISSKPVLSGAFCPGDIHASERLSTDSPKRHLRLESTPILSGGVSCKDFAASDRVSDSPIMSRRKNEFAPILSGAAPVVTVPEPELVARKPVAPAGLTSAWVVDMGQCPTEVATAPAAAGKGRRKSEGTVVCRNLQAVEIGSEDTPSPKTAPLGFFINLNEISKDQEADTPNKKREPTSAGANSQVGFFVDFSNDTSPADSKSTGKGSGKVTREEKSQSKPTSKNACGFFIDLSSLDSPKKEAAPTGKVHNEETDDNANKKTALFSMFIDISDSGSAKTSSGSSEQKNKVGASPHLSMHRNMKPDKSPESKQEPSNGDGTLGSDSERRSHPKPSDRTGPNAAAHQLDESKELKESGKLGDPVYMNVATDSPIARRKTLPSGVRPASNRHSWNPNHTNANHPSDEPRRKHKRAHSLSVDCKLVPGVDDKTSSSTSLSMCRTRDSSHSLQEATWSPGEPTSLTQFSELSSRPISSSSYSCGRPSGAARTYDRITKRTSCEGKTDSERDLSDLYSDTISEGKMINEEDSQVTDVEMADDSQDVEGFDPIVTPHSSARDEITQDRSATTVSDLGTLSATVSPTTSDITRQVTSASRADEAVVEVPPDRREENDSEAARNVVRDLRESADGRKFEESEEMQTRNIAKPEVNVVEPNPKSSLKEVPEKISVFEQPEKDKTGQDCFVRLSDLDKESTTGREESGSVLPSFASANRMTRSIPESSWIENKLLMTRSIGGGTSSRSLSRLFPHLHSTMTTTASGGGMTRSKSPADTESEMSDISSMQSSMAASGMEASTEETDTSLSRGPGPSRLGEDLLRMFLEEISPDVTIDVGGRRIRAHKCILSSRCQYFAAVLSGGWVQSAGDVISLQGFSYNAVFFALCHIYSGTNNIPDTISIVELATLSDMLALEGLKEVIMFTLKSKYCHFFHKPCTMCAVGVLECLPLAAAYGLDDIYRKSLRWITKHFVRIWPTKGFATLPRELIDKCYQQHVVHMMPDTVLETVQCCDKLLATLPSVRWAEPVFSVASQLMEAAVRFTAHHFSAVLDSRSFVSLGKELSWNISRLEESLTMAAERLPPDQACQSYGRLHQMLDAAQSSPDNLPSPSFLDLLRRLEAHTEDSLVRLAPRACRCPSWGAMPPALRRRIQDVAGLPVAPPVEEVARATQRHARHAGQAQARSISGSRNLDLRQVKLAMTQQARRAASGGRVSTLRADVKPAKKSQPIAVIHPQRFEDSAPVSEDGAHASMPPKAWQLQVFENSTRSSRQRSGDVPAAAECASSSLVEKVPSARRKTMLSSSDSSRTASPAMRRAAAREARVAKQTAAKQGAARQGAATAGRLPDQPLEGNSNELRRQRKEADVNMSDDSLADTVEEKPKSPLPLRVDPPSSRRKHVEPTNIDAASATTSRDVSIKTVSIISTTRKQLGDEAAMSSDSLATEASFMIDEGKSDLRLDLPTSPLVGKGAAKRATRAPLISPRESNTSRLRSAAAAASLQAAQSRANPPADTASPNRIVRGKAPAVIKASRTETLIKTASPGSSVAAKKMPTSTRFPTKQSVASPARLTPPTRSKAVARTPSKEVGSPKAATVMAKVSVTTTQVIHNGVSDRTRKIKKVDLPTEKVLGSRSGTFLKDEPTVLKKPSVENVQE